MLITINEFATKHNIGRTTVRDYIKRGLIKSHKPNNQLWYVEDEDYPFLKDIKRRGKK